MSQADMLTEAQALLLRHGDTAFMTQAYPEEVRALAQQSRLCFESLLVQGITGHAVYTLPMDHFEVLSIIYYPDELDEEPVHALNIADPSWRTLSTRPKW
jgi:hypothetical protein